MARQNPYPRDKKEHDHVGKRHGQFGVRVQKVSHAISVQVFVREAF